MYYFFVNIKIQLRFELGLPIQFPWMINIMLLPIFILMIRKKINGQRKRKRTESGREEEKYSEWKRRRKLKIIMKSFQLLTNTVFAFGICLSNPLISLHHFFLFLFSIYHSCPLFSSFLMIFLLFVIWFCWFLIENNHNKKLGNFPYDKFSWIIQKIRAKV